MPDILPRLMRGVAGKLPVKKSAWGITLSEILGQWEKIVGEEYASKTLPTALKWRKTSKTELERDKDAPETKATLHIIGPAAMCLELTYQQPLIVSRFNLLFGLTDRPYRLSSIAVKAGERVTPAKPAPAKAPPIRVLDKTRTAIDGIDDPQLRHRLQALADALEQR